MASALTAEGLSKRYGKVLALDNASLQVEEGEVHAVLGENGAGKSTLMGVLAGFTRPDSGAAELWGSPLPFGNPAALREQGVAIVHQHFMLVPRFSALENLALDQLGSLQGATPFAEVRARAEEVLARVGWSLDLNAPVSSLPVGVQQRLEILKALMGHPRLLILDEPSAVLSPDEVLDLVRVVKALKGQGVTLILIAHKLSEVYAMADRVTVLRKGRLVAASPLAGLEQKQLASWMVGDFPGVVDAPPTGALGGVLLRLTRATVAGDRGEDAVRDASLEVRAGEILGIGGVDGNGQLELAEALAQVRPLRAGELALESSPAYIPQDRQVDGLALGMPIWENLLIKGVSRADLFRGGLLSPGRIAVWAKQLIQDYSIKAGSPNDPARSLSGGNQQKVVVSRSLSGEPQIIVAMNPTRGLDIRASSFVHEELRKAALRGAGVVLVSTDLDELASLATRTLYMSSGKLSSGGAEAYLGGAGT